MRLSRYWWILVVFGWCSCFSEPESPPIGANHTTASNGGTDNAVTTGCVPADERCDGQDNDCDGEVDEGFDVGASCAVGVGACANAGALVCAPDGTGTVCDAEAGAPADELCGDDIDNDCDAQTDEGFFDLGEACTAGLGQCRVSGVVVCGADGVGTACDAEPPAPPEADEVTCDGLDNDCDGEVDEGCDDDGDGYCDADFAFVAPGATPICPNGEGDCDDGAAAIYPGAPGSCDGLDNDCDGEVDEFKRAGAASYTLAAVAGVDQQTSPIQAIASDTGFCIFMVGGAAGARDQVRAHVETAPGGAIDAAVTPTTRELRVADIAWNGNNCAALVIDEDGDAALDLRLNRWSKSVATGGGASVIEDGVTHIASSWDASVEFANNVWVVAYVPTSGNAAQYRTLPATFDAFSTPAAPLPAGLVGTFPELGASPGSGDLLFVSNFANINVHEFTVGDLAAPVAALGISGSLARSNLAMAAVGGTTWLGLQHASTVSAWELRTISSQLTYGFGGMVPYALAPQAQEFVTRNPFVAGPLQSTWFLDSIDEKAVVVRDDGAGGLDALAVVDPTASGELLGGRQVDADITELLWLTATGSQNGGVTTLEVAQYTCF